MAAIKRFQWPVNRMFLAGLPIMSVHHSGVYGEPWVRSAVVNHFNLPSNVAVIKPCAGPVDLSNLTLLGAGRSWPAPVGSRGQTERLPAVFAVPSLPFGFINLR